MKRVVCLIVALYACFCSVFAWNAESFLGDGLDTYQPYELEPVVDPVSDPAQVPMMLSLDDGIALASVANDGSSITLSGDDLFMSLSSSENMAMVCEVYHEGSSINTGQEIIEIPSWTEYRSYPTNGLPIEVSNQPNEYQYRTAYFVVPSVLNSGSVEGFLGPCTSPFDGSSPDSSITLDLDISSLGGFNTFGLSGVLNILTFTFPSIDGSYIFSYGSTLDIIVNGAVVHTFDSTDTNSFDLGSYFYQGTQLVDSIQFRIYCPLSFKSYSSVSRRVSFNILKTSTMELTVLKDNEVLMDSIGDAQNSINDHNSIESEWTGSMTENFNKLDLSGFTYPDGLVAGFALITGIFNDLWNGMGEYKILYVFPLTLGVVLLLIGRISKFSGRGSTSRSGKGDDSA